MTNLAAAIALAVSFGCIQSADAQETPRTERRIAAAVREWRDPPNHARELLVIESISLRDARVADAAMTAAENGRLPLHDRLAALRVILTFAMDDPRAAINFDSGVPASGDLSVPLGGSSPHAAGVAGAQPVTPATTRKLRMRLQRLASSDPNRQVRSAAKDVLTAASHPKRAP